MAFASRAFQDQEILARDRGPESPRAVEARARDLYPKKMKMKLALVAAMIAGCELFSACAETQKTDESFSQSTTEYDTVLQGDHSARSWKKVSRAPSAISTPAPAGDAAP